MPENAIITNHMDVCMYNVNVYVCVRILSCIHISTINSLACSDIYSSEANQLSVTIKSTAHLPSIKKLPGKSN